MAKDKIGIIGLGLIGGSLGMALRGRYVVKGMVHRSEDAEYALSAGIADEIASGTDDFGDCTALIVCTPLSIVRETVEKLAAAYPDKIISDVGSVKGILRGIKGRVIGGHPMAGTEKSGIRAAKERLLDINPNIKVNSLATFFTPETSDTIDFSVFDYVVDAIDTVSGKIALVQICNNKNIPIISSMGTGNKLDPTKFEVTDIFKTSMCPLAKVMRYELKKRGIKKLKVVYSKEEPKAHKSVTDEEAGNRRSIPASVSFVPPVAGLIIAGEVIKDLVDN